MANFTSVSNTVLDRFGRSAGVDVISTPNVPSTPPAIGGGCVRVTCSCGRVYDNVPQAQWDKWPAAPKEVDGVCGCVAHFV